MRGGRRARPGALLPASPVGPIFFCEGATELPTQVKRRFIDVLSDAYVDWREECYALQSAYDRWSRAEVEDRGLRFAAYAAALDREEQASSAYAACVGRIQRETEAETAERRRLPVEPI